MPYARSNQLREVIELVADGESVTVVGLPGSGRTELLTRASRELDRGGRHVLRLSDITLGPNLNDALAKDARGLRAHLAKQLRAVDRPVLIVDDPLAVPRDVAVQLDALLSHLRLPALLSATPGSRSQPSPLPLTSAAATRVPLQPLTYDDVADLLREDLGTAADPALVARVSIKSAGNPGLIRSLVKVGKRASLIAERDGAWYMTASSLWHRHLVPAAERLIHGVSDAEYHALFALSLAGPLPLSECSRFMPDEVLTALSRSGRIAVIGDRTAPALVAVTPPLVSDYFRHLPSTAERELILARLPESARPPVGRWVMSMAAPEPAPTFESGFGGADAAAARYIEEQAQADEEVHWMAWSEAPGLVLAVPYLETAFTTRTVAARVAEVVQQTPLQMNDAASAVIAFFTYGALLLALEADDRGPIDALLDRVTGARPDLLVPLRRRADLVRIYCGDLGDVEDLGDTAVEFADDGLAAVSDTALAAALQLALRGRGEIALHALESATESGGFSSVVRDLAEGLARFSMGSIEKMLESGATGLADPVVRLDRPRLMVWSYISSLALVRRGRWREAEQVLGAVLAMGSPPLALVDLFASMARLTAMLSARSGNPDFAERLLQAADLYSPRSGSLPGAQIEISAAVRHLIAGDDPDAGGAMLAAARAARDRGHLLAATSLALYGVCLAPSSAAADLLVALTSEQDETHVQFARFASAVIDSPADALRLATAYAPDADTFLAVLLLRTIAGLEVRGTPVHTACEEAMSVLAQRADEPLSASYFPDAVDVRSVLSGREIEIAQMAGRLTNAQISEALRLSSSTVANHISAALRKTGTASRGELFDMVRRQTAEDD